MARAFAFTQFLIVSLGALTLHLLVRIDSRTAPVETIGVYAQFLARHALWLFAVPILYGGIGNLLEGRVGQKVIKGIGIALCVLLAILVGWPIWYHLS